MLKIIKKIINRGSSDKESVVTTNEIKDRKSNITSTRIGQLGEYKINIQLDQLPKNSRYISDLLIPNSHAKSGYSQIDHVIVTPYVIFVVETKNYAGTLYGDRKRDHWSINGKFSMLNPFNQNYGHIQAIQAILENVDDSNFVSLVSFTKRCTFKVNEELRKIQFNDLIVYDTELSEFINRKINVLKLQHKNELFSDKEILHMYNVLDNHNIADPEIRKQHVEKLKLQQKTETANEFEIKPITCTTCGKVVSEKVVSFCLANKKRFNGKVYCYEHQNHHH